MRVARNRSMQYLEIDDQGLRGRGVAIENTSRKRERLIRDDTDGFMRALIRFAWEDLSIFPTPEQAVDTCFGATWIVPEYPSPLPGTIAIADPRAPRTMAALRRVQAQVREDLERLAEERELFVLQVLAARIEKRVPRLRFVLPFGDSDSPHGFWPDSREPLLRVLYYGLGLALSRGALTRLAKCSCGCGRAAARKLDRQEKSGHAFYDKSHRWNFHNRQKTREDRAEEQRYVRAARRARGELAQQRAAVKQQRAAAASPASPAVATGSRRRRARGPAPDRGRAPRMRLRTSTPHPRLSRRSRATR